MSATARHDENDAIVAEAQAAIKLPSAEDRLTAANGIVQRVSSNGYNELTRKRVKALFRDAKVLTVGDYEAIAREARKTGVGADSAGGPHEVNMSADTFSYSTGRAHGSCSECITVPRGLYQEARFAGGIPELHALPVHGEGSSRQSEYLLSRDQDSPRVSIPGEEIESGKWSFRIGMPRSADRRIRDALATVVLNHLAEDAPEVPAFPSAEVRDATGHLFVPVPECLPPGYLIQRPGLTEAEAVETGRRIAEIVAQTPKTALALGMAVDAPFVSATRRQPSWIKFYGPKRQGKTTVLFLVASVWGRVRPPTPSPDQTVQSWDATTRGPGRFLGQLGILPPFFDETGTAEFSEADWARLVYGTTQGSSRLQAEARGMGSRATPGWRGRMFITGNDMLCDGMAIGKFDGLPARLLQFPAPFTTSGAECEELEELVTRWYGWLGPAALARFTPEEWADLMAVSGSSKMLSIPDGGLARTLGKDLAGGVAGAMAVDQMLGTGTLVTDAALIAAQEYLDKHRGEMETPGQRMLSVLRESMTFHRPAWASREAYVEAGETWSAEGAEGADRSSSIPRHGQERELSGFYDTDWLYVKPAVWRAAAEAEGAGSTAALAELFGKGTLYVTPARRRRNEWTSEVPRWAGRGDCYRLRMADVMAPGEDDAEDQAEVVTDEKVTTEATEETTVPTCSVCHEPMTVYELGQTTHPMCEGWEEGTVGAAVNTSERKPEPPVHVTPAPAPADLARGSWLAEQRTRTRFRGPAQEAFEQALAILDEPGIGDHPERLRLLGALEGDRKQHGPFSPHRSKRGPWWQAPMPAVSADTRISAPNWEREDYRGSVVVLDRNAAWPSAASSVSVVHGGYENTGPQDEEAPVRPGYYLVTAYPWTESGMPSPLGTVTPGDKVAIPGPRMALLRELAKAGRWPDGGALDSWTGEPCRLTDWAHLVGELRRYALEVYGRGSEPYEAVKVAFGQTMGLLLGSWDRSDAMPRKIWKCKARRPDWPHHVQDQASVTLWRAADECLTLTGADLGPVAIRNVDELVIPAAALDAVTAHHLEGRSRPPVRIDPSGVQFGTFKVKSEGEV